MDIQSIKNERDNRYVPLSQSHIWKDQCSFYLKKTIQAWNGSLPYYATSNPYIADSYAQIIVNYWQDLLRLNSYNIAAPIYIVELGTGTGAFSYYLIKKLIQLQQNLQLTQIKWCYVMTDLVAANIEFWKNQPNLRRYIEQGYIDFAVFDAEKQQNLYLQNSKMVLDSKKFNNPAIVIANYVFDTLSHDFWRLRERDLQYAVVKSLFDIDYDYNNIPLDLIGEVKSGFHYKNAELPFYGDSEINEVLKHYQDTYKNISFSFPIGTLECLSQLVKLTNGQLLVLATDKAYVQHDGYYEYCPEKLALHNGAFSVLVNFYALQQYVKQQGGDAYIEKSYHAVSSAAFVFGHKLKELTHTYHTVTTNFNRSSTGGILDINEFVKKKINWQEQSLILACLNNSCWDDKVFNVFYPAILEATQAKKRWLVQHVCEILPNIAENFYYMPWGVDTLFNIGRLLEEVENYQSAIIYYLQSINYFGRTPQRLHHTAVCHYMMGNISPAAELWQEVLEIEEDHLLALSWLALLQEENNKKDRRIK